MKHLQYFKEMLGAANPAFAELNKNVAAEQEKRNDEAKQKNAITAANDKKQRRAKIEADAKQKGWNGTDDLYNFLVKNKGQQKQNFFQKVGGAIKAGWSGTDEDFILMYDEPSLPYIDPKDPKWQQQHDQIQKRKQELIQQHQQKK
jgi:hypothetical protein